MAEIGLAGQHLHQRAAQRSAATAAGGGAQVQVGQAAVKQPGQLRADAVAVPQQGLAVAGLEPRQLVRQGRVVGLPVVVQALRHLGRIGRLAGQVERLTGEEAGRAQLGVVGAGVHRRVLGRAVQVDHITRMVRHQHAGAQIAGKAVKRFQVPVGVFPRRGTGRVAWLQGGRDVRAHMGQAQQQRGVAAVQGEDRFGVSHDDAPARHGSRGDGGGGPTSRPARRGGSAARRRNRRAGRPAGGPGHAGPARRRRAG